VNDFTNEFFKRSLLLAASLYDHPQTTEINLPPVNADRPSTPPSTPQILFASPIADLRLRRRIAAVSEPRSITEELDAIDDSLHNSAEKVDLTEVFGDTFVRVPVKSRLDDPDEVQFRRAKPARPMNMHHIRSDAAQRLAAAEERGQQSAKKRKYVLEHHSPTPEKTEAKGPAKAERIQSPKTETGKERKSPHSVRF
jgi:hypothetical protein